MAKKGKGCKHPKGDWLSQNESEDYFQRHAHEQKQRTFQQIKALNANMEAMRNPEEPAPEKPTPRSEFRQKRHEIVKDEDMGM